LVMRCSRKAENGVRIARVASSPYVWHDCSFVPNKAEFDSLLGLLAT